MHYGTVACVVGSAGARNNARFFQKFEYQIHILALSRAARAARVARTRSHVERKTHSASR